MVVASESSIYCEAVVRYQQANRLLEGSGLLIKGARGGELIRNPLLQVVDRQAELVKAYARELGLTPSARTGLTWQQQPSTVGQSALAKARQRRALHSVG